MSSRKANDLYQPGTTPMVPPAVAPACTRSPCVCASTGTVDGGNNSDLISRVLEKHSKPWEAAEEHAAHTEHGLMSWTQGGAPGIQIARAEGVHFWDTDGKRYMDFNSMAMCSNHGHTIDPSITEAIVEQINTVPYAYPGLFAPGIRGRLESLLADICPGDLNTFMFPSSGAEANEGAMRMARRFTGRSKIMTRHRSYHGGTTGALAATGDFRRWAGEGLASGDFVKFFDPFPYSFSLGKTEEEVCAASLAAVEEAIKYEGPHQVAAILIEPITGTNGVLFPLPGYLEGIRALCDEHGIMMICDEVMCGFGRSGKLFGFCHAPSVVPDFITFAKGVNTAVVPLAGIGMRQHIADFFRENTYMVGSTYHSHPVSIASGYAALKVMLRDGLVARSAAMGPVMEECMNSLLENHPSVKQARCRGLFGAFDVQRDRVGTFIGEVDAPLDPAMAAFKAALMESGLFTMMRGHTVFTNPPLVISEDELREGFDIIDKALPILDDAMDDA
eukprot:CAMPEP_0182916022 /NCGR_PEP_ID=MMETSP0105_2-20130417/694_1 /TAXON_ID=81532 ORGANISM="Acanthoeca-like sp., Strain 10tr" /NCGR_SAMPLE_ID=MMETSP0105_2 /ASSEMBLY_ACC=CAM_ASM_000205 /LENGTH=502 /DNA_ID=CAMNT_0025052935 /DNA_START=22 /DNA_END=1530 /DNA_ORIENTATION=-